MSSVCSLAADQLICQGPQAFIKRKCVLAFLSSFLLGFSQYFPIPCGPFFSFGFLAKKLGIYLFNCGSLGVAPLPGHLVGAEREKAMGDSLPLLWQQILQAKGKLAHQSLGGYRHAFDVAAVPTSKPFSSSSSLNQRASLGIPCVCADAHFLLAVCSECGPGDTEG